MKYICAQPAINYYAWQIEVMLNNFIEVGIPLQDVHIVCGIRGKMPEAWRRLRNRFHHADFFFYEDDRFKSAYHSNVRAHILSKHWRENPELERENVFYHDCDIVFTGRIDFSAWEADDVVCHVSDTVFYTGAQSILACGTGYLELMTAIVGVDPQWVLDHEKDSGGAQYFLKKIPASYWEKVYWDCEHLYRAVSAKLAMDKQARAVPIGFADMWAVLWNLWVYEKEVRVSKNLSFSWANSPIEAWDQNLIHHNAGVAKEGRGLFYKAAYEMRLPYDIELAHFSNNYCSYKYVESILKTARHSCLL
jgi:hypothetical protein